jgi:type III restriction enzyme
VRAINELKPILGLELSATPYTESAKGPVPFRNVVLDYPLGCAIADGFVKQPAVVTRKDFDPAGMTPEEIERLKLEDGIRLHEQTKVELETYARESEQRIVKPFVLAIARDTAHAARLVELMKSDEFFGGRYREKVIQVDSSTRGSAEGDDIVERLLKVEQSEEPTEIVVHVNMLKEGWDVTNLYTIVPLRTASARTLVEQSIGRGLRLPYGRPTGVSTVDRLSIVAHDRFQEIVDDCGKADSPVRIQAIVIDGDDLGHGVKTVVAIPAVEAQLGIQPENATATTEIARGERPPAFTTPREQAIARTAYERIHAMSRQADLVPGVAALSRDDVKASIVADVTERLSPAQLELEGVGAAPDVEAIVERVIDVFQAGTIDMPRVLLVPVGEVRSYFEPFELDLSGPRYAPPSQDLFVQYLQSRRTEMVGLGEGGFEEQRLEDHLVRVLIDYDDALAAERLEGVPQQQQLGLGVGARPLMLRIQPGGADLEPPVRRLDRQVAGRAHDLARRAQDLGEGEQRAVRGRRVGERHELGRLGFGLDAERQPAPDRG